MCGASSYRNRLSNMRSRHMHMFSKQLSNTAVRKWRMHSNSQRIMWFIQGIYYKWLTSRILWMNCSNLHLIWITKAVSLLYKLLQVCCRSGLHFISVPKIVHRSPGSHNKDIYMNFFFLLFLFFILFCLLGLTKFESCSTWYNLRYQTLSSFCFSSVIRIQVTWGSWWRFKCFIF